jgi:uncharacterized protein (DUF1499 family)
MMPEPTPTVASARWSCRLALFSASLILVTLALHRLGPLGTPLALNLAVVGYAGSALAFLISLVALVRIWSTGHAGAGAMAVGLLLPLVAFAGPAGYVLTHLELPRLNDVTTDTASPPAFAALATRPKGANASAYPGRPFAELQAKGYPDLRPLVLERSVEEAYELVEDAVRRLRWQVVATQPLITRESGGKIGQIEAVDYTLLVGFTDDIVIRIEGGPTRARIDARSASRYGRYDFGANASRLRRLLAEVRTRAEMTPSAGALVSRALKRGGKTARTLVKRQKARDQRKAEGRNARGPAKSDAQRVPTPKGTPR